MGTLDPPLVTKKDKGNQKKSVYVPGHGRGRGGEEGKEKEEAEKKKKPAEGKESYTFEASKRKRRDVWCYREGLGRINTKKGAAQ